MRADENSLGAQRANYHYTYYVAHLAELSSTKQSARDGCRPGGGGQRWQEVHSPPTQGSSPRQNDRRGSSAVGGPEEMSSDMKLSPTPGGPT